MADYPPYMNNYGVIPKILNRIKEAKTPPRFTMDFLSTDLGFPGGSPRPFIGFAKRLGLLGSDGAPTDTYKAFRNPGTTKPAMATALKTGYEALFKKNEYAHKLEKAKLEGLVMEITGLEQGNPTVRSICNSFEAVKQFADFDAEPAKEEQTKDADKKPKRQKAEEETDEHQFQLGLSYTINLVLPKTDDVAVFNAIFRSLRENLLRK